MGFNDSIWITWERHRRSTELANAFGVKLYILLDASSDISFRPFRYIYLSIKTLSILIKERPRLVFAQNPSIILALILCKLKRILKYKLIIDRHSNFKLETVDEKKIKWRIFHFISKYSVKNTDLTIVTNDYLCKLVNTWGGNGFILQDKLPELSLGQANKLDGEKNIVFISTFSEDEPISELIKAGKSINNSWIIYITGNYKNYLGEGKEEMLHVLPENIRLTGFLPEKEYQSLLMSADLLVVLTSKENILTCGAYEGVSLSKPMVLSDTKVIRDYFKKGVVYSKPDNKSISAAIKQAILSSDTLKKDIEQFKTTLEVNWDSTFSNLCKAISELP